MSLFHNTLVHYIHAEELYPVITPYDGYNYYTSHHLHLHACTQWQLPVRGLINQLAKKLVSIPAISHIKSLQK